MVRIRPFVISLLAALFLTGAQPLLAAEEYSDAKLQSFVDAVLAVNAVVEQWRPQIQTAPNEADAQQMAQQANEEMRAAVAGTEGITVEEYQAIAQAAQADPQLMARIDQAIKDKGPAAQQPASGRAGGHAKPVHPFRGVLS
jgi:prophage tail gpP-like protein